MKNKTHFTFRIEIWDDTGDSIVEHVAGIDDFEVAEAGRFVTPTAPRLASARDSPWGQDTSVRFKFWLMHPS